MSENDCSTAKPCSRCGEQKPTDAFPSRGRVCKKCKSAQSAEWVAANRERARATLKAYREAHRDEIRAKSAAWRAANLERLRAEARDYGNAHREERAARFKDWRAANPYTDEERTRKAVQARARYGPEVRRYQAEYRRAHPDISREQNAIRRARKRNAPVVERIRRAVVWERDQGICHICRRKCDPANWHLDHIVPLSRGGEHSYRNVAVSHPRCNERRHASGPAQLRLE